MKIIAVDDEHIALRGLLDVISEAAPDAELNGFEYPEDALDFVDEHGCNIAFLDVEMPSVSGVGDPAGGRNAGLAGTAYIRPGSVGKIQCKSTK